MADRIVFMRVALCALNGQAKNRFPDGIHAVKHRFHSELLRIDSAFFIDHRIAQESRRHHLLLRRIRNQVAGKLLLDESVIGQILVQRLDHPIAIKPDIAHLVFFVAVRVGIPCSIQPVAAPAFTVMGRSEQTIHLLFISVGGLVSNVCIHFFNRWWQPSQIERKPPQQSNLVRLRGWLERFLFQLGKNECVNRIL